jgi:ankyrin repeat protein
VDVNGVCKSGRTPLFYAVEADALGAVVMLLEMGARVDVALSGGLTCLHLAKSEAVRALLKVRGKSISFSPIRCQGESGKFTL